MDLATTLIMIQAILQLLDSSIMKKLRSVSVWSVGSQLTKIKKTMVTIQAVLLEAERQESQQVECSEPDRVWLEQLRDVVYDVDDLLDELDTVAQQENLNLGFLLSHPGFAFEVSKEVRQLRMRLDDIAKDRRDFGLGLGQAVSVPDHRSIKRRRKDESHSFVCDEEVIGRDQDKEAVVDMLLDSSVAEDVSFVKIVGIGGLGKTTLAQLAYNDDRIQREFELKIWVCVSDDFNIKAIVSGILGLGTGSDLEMEQLQSVLRAKLDGQKYLLVLDDLWNEDLDEWLKLKRLLVGGRSGSRIVVTTRSRNVANILGNGPMYELQRLSDDDSWRLFERLAFNGGKERADDEFAEIGRTVLNKCANVPLVIRVVGSLLNGQSKSKWQSFLDQDLATLKRDDKNPIFPILKLSYHHLASPLKSCFKYCAVFPKDHEILKEDLISMWIAQGFIGPSNSQSLEDVGEDYFLELLERCFFQDVKWNEYGEITSCKIHDLMHDVAQQVAGSEIVVVDFTGSRFERQVRHLCIQGPEVVVTDLATNNQLRTFICLCVYKPFSTECVYKLKPCISDAILSINNRFRVLSLCGIIHFSSIKQLLSKVDKKLIHLRYLDLSWNVKLEVLPRSIAKLCNLKTLKLLGCNSLKKLPRGLSKLVNLRELDIERCESLTYMPARISDLTCLQKLPLFVVGAEGARSLMKKNKVVGQLEELKAITSLGGCLEIKILEGSNINGVKVKEAQCLSRMERLKEIGIEWPIAYEGRDGDDEEVLLEGLEPHHNLRRFRVENYVGVRFPSWGILLKNNGAGTPPPSNLVEITLDNCRRLQHLPSLSQLQFLKFLEMRELEELEYVESSRSGSSGDGDEGSGNWGALASATAPSGAMGVGWSTHAANFTPSFFPSLVTLDLVRLPKLKGWWRPSGSPSTSCSFPHLSSLSISGCPNLTCLPLCPNLEELTLVKFSERLLLGPAMKEIDSKRETGGLQSLSELIIQPESSSKSIESLSPSPSSSDTNWQKRQVFSLKKVVIDDVGYLKSLPLESLESLSHLSIHCSKQDRWSRVEVGEVFRTRLSSLRSLHIGVSTELDLNLDDDEDGMPWRCLSATLRSLTLSSLPKLVKLPKGMHHLTSLHSLFIISCENLEELPEWLPSLTSLHSLQILNYSSSRMKQRCQQPNGEDWPKVQHIPQLKLL